MVAPALETTCDLKLEVGMSEYESGAVLNVPTGAVLEAPPKSFPRATAKPDVVS